MSDETPALLQRDNEVDLLVETKRIFYRMNLMRALGPVDFCQKRLGMPGLLAADVDDDEGRGDGKDAG